MDGSGYRAIIDGYDVAGKTGTAEMVIDGKYSKEGEKRTYFVGFSRLVLPCLSWWLCCFCFFWVGVADSF